jgi:hypothetical protein
VLNRLTPLARWPLELPTIFVIFDSAFALIWKVFYVEKRAFPFMDGPDVLKNDLKDNLKDGTLKARW